MYYENLERQQHELSNFFTPIVKISRKEQEIFNWVQLILEESIPVSVIKKQSYRIFKDSDVNFSQEQVKETLFNMVEMVHEKIGIEMIKARHGTILYDGWSQMAFTMLLYIHVL